MKEMESLNAYSQNLTQIISKLIFSP